MSDEINHHRRRFLGTAATTIAAASLGVFPSAEAQTRKTQRLNTSFGPLKQIDAGLLNIGYAEAGPTNGPAAILLHGWPYDIHSYVDVAPLLASAGYRVIIPYLRGYGTTRFLSSETFRNSQQSVVALDIIALMDALKIKKAILAGFDWGARTVDVMAATGMILTSSSGRTSRRTGTSMMLRSIALQRRSTTRITSTSSSIITAGD